MTASHKARHTLFFFHWPRGSSNSGLGGLSPGETAQSSNPSLLLLDRRVRPPNRLPGELGTSDSRPFPPPPVYRGPRLPCRKGRRIFTFSRPLISGNRDGQHGSDWCVAHVVPRLPVEQMTRTKDAHQARGSEAADQGSR